MYFVVAYDIRETKRRNRLARKLRGFGKRSQLSVFDCPLDDDEFEQLLGAINKIIDKSEDKVTIFPLCAACYSKVVTLGQARLFPEEDVVVL